MTLLRMSIRTALRALRRNKLRSALTMLGIVIGVAAVIAMVSLGQGANAAVQQQMRSLGTNLLMVIPGATTAAGVRSGWGGVSTLTVGDGEAIARDCPDVTEVSWMRRQVVQAVFGDQNWSTVAQGVTPSYVRIREWSLAAGEFFSDRDEATAQRVAVLGQTVVHNLFGVGVDPVGEIVRVKDVPFRIVGVLAPKGQSAFGQDQDDVILMPFSTAERRTLGAQILGTVDLIFAKVRAADRADAATEQITALLHDRHRIQHGEANDFTVRSLSDMAQATEAASRVMASLLLGVASISLLVGGIGIMNILLVSVTERTREIGIRMAVGAREQHILLQFLIEAVALSVAGGIAGAILGAGVSLLIA
ncbi:MAG: ABC transporter permease, partial [Deltaproteobacteria bacterium]|nr:ABC transporter permease [Deltaproteobacteria bacterium]